jgi:arsenate reductase
MELHGIPNCSTVRSARAWLADRGLEYRFIDFKKEGVDLAQLAKWQRALGWEALLNRKGATWRGLPEARREAVNDAATAAALMAEFPSLIKRPVLADRKRIHAGFSEEAYEALFEGADERPRNGKNASHGKH